MRILLFDKEVVRKTEVSEQLYYKDFVITIQM